MPEYAIEDRMKLMEGIEAHRILIPKLPVMVRCDGRAFHTWTKGLERPYDTGFSMLMQDVTQFLVEETNARVGYMESDEITLMLYSPDTKSETFFNGRIQKLVSVIASMCTAKFNDSINTWIPGKTEGLAYFDCRVWNVPTLDEAANVFVWREMDATRNSVSMAAQSYYSHNELMNKNESQMHEMLMEKGVNWNNYPDFFRRGSYMRKVTKEIKFTSMEIEKLPPKHAARTNPDLMVTRSVVEDAKFPPILRIKNRVEALFFGANPVLGDSNEPISTVS